MNGEARILVAQAVASGHNPAALAGRLVELNGRLTNMVLRRLPVEDLEALATWGREHGTKVPGMNVTFEEQNARGELRRRGRSA